VRFLWANGISVKDIHKEMFAVYGGKCLSRKVLHNWVEKFSQDIRQSHMMPHQVRKWLRQQSKTSVLRVSANWQSDGTSVLMLVEDISRNKRFF
jgi:hypothetical protein